MSTESKFVKLRAPQQSGPRPDSKVTREGAKAMLAGKLIRGKKGRGRRGRSLMGGMSLPPQMECTITIRHRYRYYASSSATNVNTTVGHLLIACGGIGTIANSTIASFASAIRVRRIQLWSAVVTTGAVDAEIVWEAVNVPQIRDSSKQSSFPLGVTVDRVLTTSPPAGSLCSFWQNSSVASNVVFQTTCNQGSIIDVEMEATLGNNLSNYASSGFAAVTQNTVYYGRLDGIGGKFTPLGLPSTN